MGVWDHATGVSMGLRVVGEHHFARSPGCGFAEAKRGHKVDQALRARPSISIS